MSIQAVSFVLDSDVPEVAAKMLLVCLANAHNNETGLCCPSVNRLAEESNMSRRSVQRWIKWLDENGFVEVIEVTSSSGRQQSNSYRLVGFYRGAKLTPLPRMGGVTVDTGEGDTAVTPEGVTCGTPLKEPEEYRKNEPERVSASELFELVWQVFPRRKLTNREEAVAAFLELSEAEQQRCHIAAQRYRQWHTEDSEQRNATPESQLEFRTGLGKWIRSGAWIAALTVPLKTDPVPPATNGLVVLASDHPDFIAVQNMRGKAIMVGNSGKATFRIEEIEQARAST